MRQSLKVKFLLYISVLIICAMSISTGVTYISSRDTVNKIIMQQLSQLVTLTANHIAFWINNRKQDLTNWSQQFYQTSLEDRAARQSASLRLKEQNQNYRYYESLNLANAQGEILASSDEKVVGKNIEQRQFFKESLKGNVYLSSAMKSPDTRNPVFIISVPLKRADTVEGVFYGIIDIAAFNDLFIMPIKIGKTGDVYVIAPSGTVIAHPDKSNILNVNVNTYDWGREIMRQKQGFITYAWKDIEKIVFFQEHKDLGWIVAAGAGTNEIFAPVKRLQVINLFITLIFIIVAILSVIILYGHIILRPMHYLMDGIARFGKGELGRRIELATEDEFGSLAEAFNKMAQDLEKTTVSRDELVKENAERKRAEEQLKSAYEQLRATEAQLIQSAKMASLSVLAGGVAHEINNPLTGVLNNVQLIKMEIETKKEFKIEEFKELLDTIEESALRCKRITQSLLDFSMSSRGTLRPLSINEVIEKVVTLIEHELSLQNIAIQKDLPPDLPQVLGDPQLLQQVIFDIITNASRAIQSKSDKKEKKGLIAIKTDYETQKNTVSISISDTGIGIPKENLERIFEPFFTTDESPDQGTGLGLSIAHSIIREHKGNIKAESQAGTGATFRISLPAVLKNTNA